MNINLFNNNNYLNVKQILFLTSKHSPCQHVDNKSFTAFQSFPGNYKGKQLMLPMSMQLDTVTPCQARLSTRPAFTKRNDFSVVLVTVTINYCLVESVSELLFYQLQLHVENSLISLFCCTFYHQISVTGPFDLSFTKNRTITFRDFLDLSKSSKFITIGHFIFNLKLLRYNYSNRIESPLCNKQFCYSIPTHIGLLYTL